MPGARLPPEAAAEEPSLGHASPNRSDAAIYRRLQARFKRGAGKERSGLQAAWLWARSVRSA